MMVENIVNTLYTYIVYNDFNGFYDFLTDHLKNSTDENCNLIVETFLNNLNFKKFYDMYAPVVKSALEKELSSRKTINYDSNKNYKEEESKILENPIFINLKKQLANKDLEGFEESLAYLVNKTKELSELKSLFSAISREIESIKDDKTIYDASKKIFQKIRTNSPLWVEELNKISHFVNNKGLNVTDSGSIKK